MKKTLILATILLSVVMGGFSIFAQAPQTASRTIADIREDVGLLIDQFRTIDNVCVVILGAQLNEELIDALDIRKQITVGKGNLNALLEEAAQDFVANAEKATFTVEDCLELVGFFLEQVNALGSEINGLREDPADPQFPAQLDNRKATKILALLGSILFQGQFISQYLGAIGQYNSALAETVAGILEADCDASPPAFIGGNEPIRVQPQLTEKGPLSFQVLRNCKIFFGKVTSSLRSVLSGLKQVPKFKKWVYKALKEVYWLLRATNFGGRAAAESLTSLTSETKIYSINGQLIQTQIGGLDVSRLANGVYLAITGSQVRKVVVVH